MQISDLLSACRLVEDTAWHPAGKAELEKWGVVQRTLFKIFLGSPLKLWASVGHWALWHFDLSLYTDKQKPRVSPSLLWRYDRRGPVHVCSLPAGPGCWTITFRPKRKPLIVRRSRCEFVASHGPAGGRSC